MPFASDSETVSTRFEAIRAQHVRRRSSGWIRGRPLLFGPMYALVLTLLWGGGLSTPRLVGCAIACVVTQGWWFVAAWRARRGNTDERNIFYAVLVSTTLYTVLLALTGGLQSQLLPLLAGPAIGLLMLHGRRREAQIGLGAVVTSVALLLLLPKGWHPPPIAYPWADLLGAVAVLHTLVLLQSSISVLVEINQSAGDTLDRMREEIYVGTMRRSQVLERMGAKVAHELKNPLAAVKGLVQLLNRSASDSRSRERLEVVGREISRMEGILADYLSFSRPLETLEPGPVDLGHLADEVLAVLEGKARAAQVALSRTGDAAVYADGRRLKEALLNLATNAIEATARGGHVEIQVEDCEESVMVAVRDTGEGLGPEDLSRVGTPFFSKREGGTGLGVVLARACIVQHGGELSFDSERGRGTTVTVTLPRTPTSREAANGQNSAHR